VDGEHKTRAELLAELDDCKAELAALRAARREEREDLAGTILDEMHQFVAILDVHGTTLRANHTSLSAVGSSPDSVLGRPFWEAPWWAVSPELQATMRGLVERAAAGELVHAELRHLGGGGKELIDVDFTLKPVRDAAGRVTYLIPEGRDITERKRAEEEIVRKNDELSRLYEKLQEFDQLKTQFFANVSHELRTPLALILGPLEGLRGSPAVPAALRPDLAMIERNARTLLKLVNELLDLSKLAADKMTLAYVEADVARLCRETAANFETIAVDRGIRLELAIPAALTAEVDPEKVQRILLNLLSNAFKFTGAGGRIRVAVRGEAGPPSQVVIEVIDSGPGVPRELRERIFERFYQIEGSSTRRAGGTGLGLGIAQQLAELHGGAVEVDDAEEGGARFRLRLPRSAPSGTAVSSEGVTHDVDAVASLTTAELAPRPREARAEAAAADDARPRVLVIEDNPDMRRFLRDTLAEDYRVTTARDGQEGLEEAERSRPDLIVTDIMMPRLSGEKLVGAIRRCGELDGTPIILLTAKADEAVRVQLLQLGAQDFVMKPFLVAELRARIANWLAVSRARRILQGELTTREQDVAALAGEIVGRKQQLNAALEVAQAAREEAERASRVKTDFLNLVSHELRGPLFSLTMQLHVLQKGLAGAPALQPTLRRLETASTRLRALIDSLLWCARIKSGRLTFPRESVDVARILADVVEELAPQAELKGLTLHLDLTLDRDGDPPVPPLQSSPELIRVVLVNLVGNAVKYTERGAITVALSCDDGAHTIVVSDTGPGIPAGQHELIFQPFEHLDPIQHKHRPGVGLGLTIVRDMLGALGGRIGLTSEVGVGSRFTVTLPAREAAVA
jgi:PAS domain S-box-containing protein